MTGGQEASKKQYFCTVEKEAKAGKNFSSLMQNKKVSF